MELYSQTAHQLKELLDKRQIQSTDIIDSLKERINKIDKKIKAYVRLCEYQVSSIKYQENGILAGIPVSIKDNICIEGQETTCSSHILEGFTSPYNATVIERMKNAGAIIYGQTNMDEFAFGSSTETSYYGPTKNPWDLKRVPGGSSGGSAAAVAGDEAIMALGSDTGGSIRQPGSFCGVVGLKPTYGRVSRYGLIAFGSSLDQIGPITKDVKDSAILLNVIAGHDPMDSTSADMPVPDYTKSLVKDVKGLKIGIPKEYFIEGIDKEVKLAIEQAIKVFKDLGATCKEVSLPHTQYAVAVYYIVATSEASSNLARFDGMQYGLRNSKFEIRNSKLEPSELMQTYKSTRAKGFGQEAKRRIILGTYALSSGYYEAYYLRALKVRTKIKEDFDHIFQAYDCILTPTSPTVAFRAQERLDDPLTMYLSDIFTISANLAGIPGISIPCGFNQEGLPIGLQILGKPFDEETLFRVAYTYEQNTSWHTKKPQL